MFSLVCGWNGFAFEGKTFYINSQFGELNKITEPFYMVDKSRSRAEGGAGLGLALCKRIAELHRGRLRFESKEGQGTMVTVTLGGTADGQ